MKIKSLILLLSLCITTFASAQSYYNNNKNLADPFIRTKRAFSRTPNAGTKIPNKTNKAKSPLNQILWGNILTDLNIRSVEMKLFPQNPPKLKPSSNQTSPSTASVIDTIWNFLTHRQ